MSRTEVQYIPTFSKVFLWEAFTKSRTFINFSTLGDTKLIEPWKHQNKENLSWNTARSYLKTAPLSNRYILLKWGHFDRVKLTFKTLLPSWNFYTIWKGFRSFNAENLGSVGQRAAKLPAIKLWEWFDFARVRTRANWFEWGRGRPADFFLRPPTLTASNFDAL